MSTTMMLEDAALREQRRRQAILQAQADVSGRDLPRREIIQRVCSRALDAVRARAVAVARPDGAEMVYDIGAGAVPGEPVRVHMDASLSGICFRNRESFLSSDVANDTRSSLIAVKAFAGRSLMMVPILGPAGPLGVLMAASDQPEVFCEEDLQTMELFAGIIASAVVASSATAERELLVAERAAALSQLHKSEALFRALTEYSDELICILDPDGTIRYSSPSIARTLGYSPDETAGKRPTDMVHDDDRQLMLDAFRDVSTGSGISRTMCVRLRHKDGSWRHVEGNARNLLHVPAVAGITCNARDVSARVEARRWLEFQAKLLATVEQAVIATDIAGKVTFWNAFAERLYGWSAGDVLGKAVQEVLIAPEREARADEIGALLEQGHSWSGEFESLRRDRTTFKAHVTVSPLMDANGQLSGTVALSFDVTERRALEEQLRQAQKMEAVGQLAGGVAHDFNNMLTAIIGYSELALLQVTSGELHDDLVEIRQASERAADLTRQLLSFSRKQVLRVETVDVARAVRGMDKMLRRIIRENIALSFCVPETPVLVEADRSQLEQIVLNLVVNARDAMTGGGQLEIAVETMVDDGGRALLRVSDTGCGMSEAVQQRIFEPFFTTKPEGHGTGLGLAVVFGIVQQLGGTIQVRSKEGVGSIFTIALPLSAAASEDSPRSDAGVARGSETILLVEDNEPLADMSVRTLRSLGYRVLRAANGALADQLDPATLAQVDLLLTDVVMPEMDGPALVQRLASRGLAPAVVYMSGYTHGAGLVSADPAIEPHFLAKPWTVRELSQVIRKALGARRKTPVSAGSTEEVAA